MSDTKDDSAERASNFTIIRGPEVPERSRPHPEIEGMLEEMGRKEREHASRKDPPEAA